MLNATFLDSPEADESQRGRWGMFWEAPRALLACLPAPGGESRQSSLWEIEPAAFLKLWRSAERSVAQLRGSRESCGLVARSVWRSDRALASGEGAGRAAELRQCFQSALARELESASAPVRIAAPTGSALTEALLGAWVFGVAPLVEGRPASEALRALAEPRGALECDWAPGASAKALRAWERWALEQSAGPASSHRSGRVRKA